MTPKKGDNQILFYETDDGEARVEVLYEDDTVWLSQDQMSKLFQTHRSVINKHINNIYTSNELEKTSTCAKFAQVQTEGDRQVKRKIDHYNLDMIISVGYRVNSQRGTKFRMWAMKKLKEYIVKGFVMDDDRLANEKPVLLNAGTVSRADMEARVREVYEAYREREMQEQILSEYEFDALIEDATQNMLPPPADD